MIKLSLKTKIKGSWDFKQGLKPVYVQLLGGTGILVLLTCIYMFSNLLLQLSPIQLKCQRFCCY